MAFNIKNFEQNINDYGISSPNKFEVTIAFPPALINMLSNPLCPYLNQFQTIMPYRAMNVNPPGVTFQANETHNLGIGPRIKMPYNAVFNELRITLIADAESIIENTFNLWLNLAYNFTYSGSLYATYMTGYRDDIVSPDIMIRKFDRAGQPILDYHLYNALPLTFVAQGLDWSAVNSLNKFSASFNYMSYSITNYK